MKSAVNKSNWVGVFFGGVLAVGLGIYAVFNPGISLFSFGVVLAIILMYQGIAEIYYAIASKHHVSNWGWVLTYGIVNLGFGSYLLYAPETSVLLVSYTILFILMFRSFNAIGASFDLKKLHRHNWLGVLFLGIIGLLISFILLEFPIATAEFSVIWVATGLVALGVFAMAYAVRLKQHLY